MGYEKSDLMFRINDGLYKRIFIITPTLKKWRLENGIKALEEPVCGCSVLPSEFMISGITYSRISKGYETYYAK